MAGSVERGDVEFAKFWEKKSVVVAAGALLVGILVPSLAGVAIDVALIELGEWAIARWYEKKFGSNKAEYATA